MERRVVVAKRDAIRWTIFVLFWLQEMGVLGNGRMKLWGCCGGMLHNSYLYRWVKMVVLGLSDGNAWVVLRFVFSRGIAPDEMQRGLTVTIDSL